MLWFYLFLSMSQLPLAFTMIRMMSPDIWWRRRTFLRGRSFTPATSRADPVAAAASLHNDDRSIWVTSVSWCHFRSGPEMSCRYGTSQVAEIYSVQRKSVEETVFVDLDEMKMRTEFLNLVSRNLKWNGVRLIFVLTLATLYLKWITSQVKLKLIRRKMRNTGV